MSLQHAAKYLAAHGRHGDSQLVHMSPGEIRGLQDLAKFHGTKLTTNPHTGLPEAFSLKSFLPAIVGAGLAATGIGAPMAALMVGGGTAVATGSLEKGLMAGLGAYGGAGLGQGLTPDMLGGGAGAAPNMAPVVDAVPSWTAPTETVVGGPIGASAGPVTTTALPPVQSAGEFAASKFPDLGGTTGANYLPTGSSPLAVSTPAASPFAATSTPASAADINAMANVGMGPNGAPVPVKPLTASDILLKNATWQTVGAAAAPVIADATKPKPIPGLEEDNSPNPVYRYEPGVASPFPQPDPRGVGQNYFPNARYVRTAAGGGVMSGDTQGDPNLMQVKTFDPVVRMARGGAYAMDRDPMKKPKGLSEMAGLRETAGLYAKGGISDLGGYSDGGRLLRGPGDGVSDSIPASIGNRQPARLADGEFVVPARIVSELGNGSTEAGARQLYAMMDRVQKARGKTVGKGRVAKKNNPTKMLPA